MLPCCDECAAHGNTTHGNTTHGHPALLVGVDVDVDVDDQPLSPTVSAQEV